MNRRLQIIAPALLATLALAAFGASNHRATVPSPPASGHRDFTASTSSGSLGAWRAAIACARAHGMPNLPDPILGPNGQITLPGLARLPTPTPEIKSACATQLSALQSNGSTDTVESASDLHALLRVAACMRRHAYPDWPDPNNRGEFYVSSAAAGTPAKMNAAITACDSLFPATGWHLVVSPSGQ